MDRIRRNIMIDQLVDARLRESANASAMIEDALKFYWDFKDKGKAMMTNSDQILKLITQGTPHFQEPNQGPVEIGSLGWWRQQYPNNTFRDNNGTVETKNRYQNTWIPADEVQWD